jgi:AmmeMemoRadiSam system protein B
MCVELGVAKGYASFLRREAMSATVRMPAVAGHFYPGKPQVLERDIDSYTRVAGQKLAARGCIVPHAGYMYSGHVAGAVFGRLQLPRRFIIMCPNHTGAGEPLAVMSGGEWETPLGKARVDAVLARALMGNYDLLSEDADAHRREHALEVQLPFLQKLIPDFSFVPIAVGTSRYEVLEGLGAAIAATLEETDDTVLVVASSDMNHYESDEITRIKDGRALDRILDLDPQGLYEVVTRHHVTMCGFGPAITMLTAAKLRGATRAELIRYATSGDISGDRDMVVGYAGVAVL